MHVVIILIDHLFAIKTQGDQAIQAISTEFFISLWIGKHRKLYTIFGCDVYLGGDPSKKKNGDDNYFIVASSEYKPGADQRYGLRRKIEQLFKELKSIGFDLEKTHLASASRLNTLLILIAMAYAWILKVGQALAQQKPRLVKKCKHGAPRNSITKLGFTEIRNAFWSGHKVKIKRVSSFL